MTPSYGFLPTEIRMVLESPGSTLAFGTSSSVALGDRLASNPRWSVTAANAVGGNFSIRIDGRVAESGELNCINTPILKPTVTALPSSLPYMLSAGKPAGGLTLVHSASCSIESIATSKPIASGSWKTDENVYSVPLNAFNE